MLENLSLALGLSHSALPRLQESQRFLRTGRVVDERDLLGAPGESGFRQHWKLVFMVKTAASTENRNRREERGEKHCMKHSEEPSEDGAADLLFLLLWPMTGSWGPRKLPRMQHRSQHGNIFSCISCFFSFSSLHKSPQTLVYVFMFENLAEDVRRPAQTRKWRS